MTDEEFYNLFNFYNEEVTSYARYVYLGYTDFQEEMMPIVHAVSEKKYDRRLSQGDKELRIDIGEDPKTIERALHVIEENLANHETVIQNSEFSVDYRFLAHQQVIDFLNRCRENGYFNSLRIIGEEYRLDEETYNELSEFSSLVVSNSNITRDNIAVEDSHHSFVVGINEDTQAETDLIIKEDIVIVNCLMDCL